MPIGAPLRTGHGQLGASKAKNVGVRQPGDKGEAAWQGPLLAVAAQSGEAVGNSAVGVALRLVGQLPVSKDH